MALKPELDESQSMTKVTAKSGSSGEAEEAAECANRRGGRPVLDNGDLGGVHGNAVARDDVVEQNSGIYTVGDFMTKREELHVVKPTTSVDEALEMLVEHRITGFPVIDDEWNLVGVVSDYDLLALDSISGNGLAEADIFPEVDSTWKTFREIQKLLSKTNGKVIGDVMTSAPLVVRETTNLEDAARLLLETKYRRLPVVDSSGKLVGIITRGNVVRAALEIKKKFEGEL
uniref:CBS domain-containing protein n=1 Tax=Oryza meridionalis TaxID=40149 RepID=A0A0E0EK49_9ORYZ